MQSARIGKRVALHYTIRDPDGNIVGRSAQGKPLEFTIGRGKVFKGLEQGVIGMCPGDSRSFDVPPELGYGLRNEARVLRLKKEELPTQQDIALGRTLQYMDESGGMLNFIIVGFDEQTVTLDGNHPFAGKTMRFEVQLVGLSGS